jgi:hypothetical protein
MNNISKRENLTQEKYNKKNHHKKLNIIYYHSSSAEYNRKNTKQDRKFIEKL